MMRIIYGAPNSDKPAGGVKVIYRHSEIIKKLGFDSAVWHPGDDQFQCTWFDNCVSIVSTKHLSIENDFIILPEIWASIYVSKFKSMGFRVGIYVQNCYYTHINLDNNNENAILDAYREADLVLSISNDTSSYLRTIFKIPESKIIQQRYSINLDLFKPGNKSKIITYMPRKMGQHSARVVAALNLVLNNDWEIRALDGMSERDIANNLSESMIFLAFSEFEGLPVPPVEAALSGNIVIGYHGQGGREYWAKPNFLEVEQGDIQEFVRKVIEVIHKFESNSLDLDAVNSSIEVIRDNFSYSNEIGLLKNLIAHIQRLSH
jgi:glycosyltransferase involved in cell wall biosynthesis